MRSSWEPPVVTSLPISATASNYGLGGDGPTFNFSLRPNPEPGPRPPRPVERPQLGAEALHSVPSDTAAIATPELARQSWEPPTVSQAPLAASHE